MAAQFVLLLLGTLGAIWLYVAAPQSVAEARGRMWTAARPDAFVPRLSLARERLSAAVAADSAGRDSVALRAYGEAADAAWRGAALAPDSAARAGAADLWASAMLGAAELMRRQGTGAGLAPDDNARLRQAAAVVDRVLAVRVSVAAAQRAEALRGRIERQLRPGPLEWLPPSR